MPALLPADVPCPPPIRAHLAAAQVAPAACIVTSRLVPGKRVVLAAWSSDPNPPPGSRLVLAADLDSLEHGRLRVLYEAPARGEEVLPFWFDGRRVSAAVADFGGKGVPGFALVVIPDADYYLKIVLYDRKQRSLEQRAQIPVGEPVASGKALVEVRNLQIRVPECNGSRFYYRTYHLEHGSFVRGADLPPNASSALSGAVCGNRVSRSTWPRR